MTRIALKPVTISAATLPTMPVWQRHQFNAINDDGLGVSGM